MAGQLGITGLHQDPATIDQAVATEVWALRVRMVMILIQVQEAVINQDIMVQAALKVLSHTTPRITQEQIHHIMPKGVKNYSTRRKDDEENGTKEFLMQRKYVSLMNS